MGWYSAATPYRIAVTVEHTGGGTTVDVQIPIPANFDHVWENTRADGFDLVPVAADGETLLTFDLSAWNQANRTGTVRVDGLSITATSGQYLLWLYYGDPDAADQSSAVTISGPLSGRVELGGPSTFAATIQPEPFGVSNPRNRIQKAADEQVFIWLNLQPLLERRFLRNNGRDLFEEPYLAVVVVTLAGVAQPLMVDVSKQRFVWDGERTWVRAFIKAGVSGTDYTVEIDLKTHIPPEASHRALQPRVLLSVRDVDEL